MKNQVANRSEIRLRKVGMVTVSWHFMQRKSKASATYLVLPSLILAVWRLLRPLLLRLRRWWLMIPLSIW